MDKLHRGQERDGGVVLHSWNCSWGEGELEHTNCRQIDNGHAIMQL